MRGCKGHEGRLQPEFLCLGVLPFSAIGKLVEIQASQPCVNLRDDLQRSPQCQFSQDAEGQRLQRLESSEVTLAELKLAQFFAQPSRRLFQDGGSVAHASNNFLEGFPILLYFGEQYGRAIAQRFTGMLVANEFEQPDREIRAGKVIV